MTTHLEDPRFDAAVDLSRRGHGTRRTFGERLGATFFVARHPGMDALATHTELARHFGDGETISDNAPRNSSKVPFNPKRQVRISNGTDTTLRGWKAAMQVSWKVASQREIQKDILNGKSAKRYF